MVYQRTASDDDEEAEVEVEDDEDGMFFGYGSTRQTAGQEEKWFPEVTKPNPAGEELLKGGEFGRLGPFKEMEKSPLSRRTLGQRLRSSRLRPTAFAKEDLARVRLLPLTSLVHHDIVTEHCLYSSLSYLTLVGPSVGLLTTTSLSPTLKSLLSRQIRFEPVLRTIQRRQAPTRYARSQIV